MQISQKLGVSLAAMALSATSQAVVLDFESGIFENNTVATASIYSQDGFDMRTPNLAGMHFHMAPPVVGNDPAGATPGWLGFHNGIGDNSVLNTITLTSVEGGVPGGTFDLYSFMIRGTGASRWATDPAGINPWYNPEMTVETSNGDVVVIPESLWDPANPEVDTPDLTYIMDFQDVTWVTFTTDEFANSSAGSVMMLDNVRINEVPVPAAAWLFGSALMGLAGFKRKQK